MLGGAETAGYACCTAERMPPSLKPIADQVIVVAGASIGIGRATAFDASKQGAKVVLAACSQRFRQAAAAE